MTNQVVYLASFPGHEASGILTLVQCQCRKPGGGGGGGNGELANAMTDSCFGLFGPHQHTVWCSLEPRPSLPRFYLAALENDFSPTLEIKSGCRRPGFEASGVVPSWS